MEGTEESPDPVAQPFLTLSDDDRIVINNPLNKESSMKEKQVILQMENNPPDYKLMFNELLYYIITTWGKLAPTQLEKIFLDFKQKGLLSPASMAIYYFLLVNKAATRQAIAENLLAGEPTVYKNINYLLKAGFIKKAGKIKAPFGGGHKPQIYAIIEATPEEIANAKLLEQQRQIPGFQLVEKMSQFMLDEWIPTSKNPKEVDYNILVKTLNRNFNLATGSYSKTALYEMVAHNLQKNKIKVWR